MKIIREVGARFGKEGHLLSAPQQAHAIHATCFCIFLQAQQPVYLSPSTKQLLEFKSRRLDYGYSANAVIAYASYEINLCERNPYFCRKYQNRLLTEAKFCQIVGIQTLNIHLGSRIGKVSKPDALNAAVERIDELQQAFPNLQVIVENAAGFAAQLGTDWEDIAYVLARVENPKQTGFSLNTSHAFSAGHDFRTVDRYEAFIDTVDTIIGLQYLKLLFFNDSQTAFNRRLDIHENLGKGAMGLELFRNFLQDPRLTAIPIILETPDISLWATEINWIRSQTP